MNFYYSSSFIELIFNNLNISTIKIGASDNPNTIHQCMLSIATNPNATRIGGTKRTSAIMATEPKIANINGLFQRGLKENADLRLECKFFT